MLNSYWVAKLAFALWFVGTRRTNKVIMQGREGK